MLTAALIAVATVAGAHPLLVGAAAATAVHPVIPLLGAAGWAAYSAGTRRRTDPTPGEEAAFLRGVAAEMRGGASLRVALREAAGRTPEIDVRRAVRYAGAGAPASAIGELVAGALPVNGPLAGAAFRLSDRSGSAAASLFDALAVRASDVAELAGERRAATAQARLSAAVVGLAPLGLTLVMVALGRGPQLSGPSLAIAAVGLGLELAGLAVIGLILWRSER